MDSRSGEVVRQEAQCPNCGEWSKVVCETYVWPLEDSESGDVSAVPIFGWWWAGSPGCPVCKALVLVETECNFRRLG